MVQQLRNILADIKVKVAAGGAGIGKGRVEKGREGTQKETGRGQSETSSSKTQLLLPLS